MFNWLSHFLQIGILLFLKNTHIQYVLNAPLQMFFWYMRGKKYEEFHFHRNNWEKVQPEKVICQLQV
jgi:hypothetical protein